MQAREIEQLLGQMAGALQASLHLEPLLVGIQTGGVWLQLTQGRGETGMAPT